MRFIKQQLMFHFLKQRQNQSKNKSNNGSDKSSKDKADLSHLKRRIQKENGDIVYFDNQKDYDAYIGNPCQLLGP